MELLFRIRKYDKYDSDNDSSDDDSVVIKIFSRNSKTRKRKLFRERWNRNSLISLAINENSFKMEYRMSYYAFNNLHSILKDNLKVNDNMARVSNMECNTESITTESRLACFLIVLGGGRVVEAMRTHGVSRT